MNKSEFLAALRQRLSLLDESEITNWLGYYSEIIADKIEDGQTEQDAVASLGGLDDIVNEIFSQTPIKKLVKTKLNRKTLRGWEIALLIVGFPLWFPLLIAAIAVVISLYAVLWSVFISLLAAALTVVVAGFALLVVSIVHVIVGDIAVGCCVLGMGLLLVGIGLFMQLGLNYVLKATVWLSKMPFAWLKRSLFVKGSAANE